MGSIGEPRKVKLVRNLWNELYNAVFDKNIPLFFLFSLIKDILKVSLE